MSKFVVLFGTLLLAVGCMDAKYDYYYISLENVSDIEIANQGKIELDTLVNNSNIPIEYKLRRDRYRLSFRIENTSYFPHVKVEVDDSTISKFTLRPIRDMSSVSRQGSVCSSIYTDPNTTSKFEFAWLPACVENTLKIISFSVEGSKGREIAVEKIPFRVVKDGVYFSRQAI